jgi:thiosulfate/3-mercaptopyruvate sulfurtransferase
LRYSGKDPEPRPGLSSGHIPNSFSLPFNLFLEKHSSIGSSAPYTAFLSPAAIRQALVDTVGAEEAVRIVTGQRPVITSCGSGMTAAILWLGLKLLGTEQVGLYDEVSLDGAITITNANGTLVSPGRATLVEVRVESLRPMSE